MSTRLNNGTLFIPFQRKAVKRIMFKIRKWSLRIIKQLLYNEQKNLCLPILLKNEIHVDATNKWKRGFGNFEVQASRRTTTLFDGKPDRGRRAKLF